MTFVKFMTSPQGRMMRVIMGVVLISVGLLVVKDTLGNILALLAIVPIAGGLLDFCVAGLALGYPFSGKNARKRIIEEHGK